MTSSHSTYTSTAAETGSTRRTAVALSVLYTVMFIGLFLTGGQDISDSASGETVIKEFDKSSTVVQIGGYGLVVAAALLVFWGAAIRQLLTSARHSWTADAILGGTVAMALTLVSWTVTMFALKDAVDSGVPEVAQAVNIMDNANFVPAMLGIACTMIAVGFTAVGNGSLPRWLAIASIVVGCLAPVGPVGFVPFTLFPFWLIAVSVLIRTSKQH
jgi:hypothetical protein